MASKLAVRVASCPATVACSLGVDVAASTCSVNALAFSASATPSINSPVCICLVVGLFNVIALPCAAVTLDTLVAVC